MPRHGAYYSRKKAGRPRFAQAATAPQHARGSKPARASFASSDVHAPTCLSFRAESPEHFGGVKRGGWITDAPALPPAGLQKPVSAREPAPARAESPEHFGRNQTEWMADGCACAPRPGLLKIRKRARANARPRRKSRAFRRSTTQWMAYGCACAPARQLAWLPDKPNGAAAPRAAAPRLHHMRPIGWPMPFGRDLSMPDLPSSIIILKVTASSKSRRSSPVMRCTLSSLYTSVLRCM